MADAATRRKQVALGLVGTGSAWETTYRDAVRRQPKRVVIRGVTDAVPARADQTARECQTVPSPSLTSLFERPEIDAVLLLDTAWYGWYPLELACRYHKPALVFGPWIGDLARLEQIHLWSRDAGVLLMTAFPLRHLPATNRLRELMATSLGPLQSVTATVGWNDVSGLNALVERIDWCSSVFGRQPGGISTRRMADSPPTCEISIQYPHGGTAQILWQLQESPTADRLELNCQHGTAVIEQDVEILWQKDGQEHRDSLTSDRASPEIIVDQFCRRVVGGLVPVSDLGDVLRSVKLALVAREQAGFPER